MKSFDKNVLLDLHRQILDQETKFSGYTNRKLPYDHKHRCATDLGISYEFKNAYQLLKDFFEDVDKTLRLARDK